METALLPPFSLSIVWPSELCQVSTCLEKRFLSHELLSFIVREVALQFMHKLNDACNAWGHLQLPLRAIDQSISQSIGCSKQRFRSDSELRPLLNAEPFSLIHAQGELGRPVLTTGPTWPAGILRILLTVLPIRDKLPKTSYLSAFPKLLPQLVPWQSTISNFYTIFFFIHVCQKVYFWPENFRRL